MNQSKDNKLIESLIIEFLRKNRTGKNASFDDVFLYVGRNFSINTRRSTQGSVPPRFYFLVESRMKSLKRRGLVFYDRKLSRWYYNEQAETADAKTTVPA